MSLIGKVEWVFLLLFAFCLFLKPCLSADDIINITVLDLEPEIEILQGECETVPFYIINKYTEPVHIYYIIDKPSDMNITSFPKDYTILNLGSSIAGNLRVCIDEDFENDTYEIMFWLETLTKFNESRVKSSRYSLDIIVLTNPGLEATTTTSIASETTTTRIHVISTIPIYTPVTTVTVKTIDIDIDIEKPKNVNLLGKDKLVTLSVIIIVLILIMMPYFTFMKSQKKK